MNSGKWITVGRIVAPHGVRGDLRVLPETERPAMFKKLKKLFLGGRAYDVRSSRPHKNVYIIHLAGVEDRNGAEPLVGTPVEIPVAELPKLPEGEYYYFQLIGLTVVSDAGDTVGTLTEIIETGANNVYAVKTAEGKEIYLPAIPSCILSVQPEKKTMTVHLPEWE
ncbi:ribosome maturation factor RimM [Dialister invisus]|jgi:16S rRNA processing protein rimM|uniref:ribosome maturation factor RimM n=1 Tax=Dialister invisus TaxID=218538 RepID=UPI003AB8594C